MYAAIGVGARLRMRQTGTAAWQGQLYAHREPGSIGKRLQASSASIIVIIETKIKADLQVVLLSFAQQLR